MVEIMQKLMRFALVFVVLPAALAGCSKDPFSLRASEDPRTPGGTYTDPISADIAVENIFYAYNEQNFGNFARTLADSFTFTFDFLKDGQPGHLVQWPAVEESRIADNIFRGLAGLKLTWNSSSTHYDIETDTTAVFYRTYEITTVTRDSIPDTTLYGGESIFYLSVTESARWLIDRWDDRHLTGHEYSWADLKSRYR